MNGKAQSIHVPSGDAERFGFKRLWLVIERESGNEERNVVPVDGGAFGLVDGVCPGCGANPFRIRTEPRQIVSHDTARYGARCLVCNDPVGWAYAQLNTIFGAEEDRAMLDKDHQRACIPMSQTAFETGDTDMTNDDQPTMTCPQCRREEPDFDGFGMLAHTKPAYEHGCGYCSHPTRDGDGKGNMVCGICGDMESATP